jgi:hypothetical protein
VERNAVLNTETTAFEPQGGDEVTFLWIILAVLYIALWVTLGMTTFRKGHTALFWFGIIFPVLWIVGAIMQPTPAAAAAESRASLQ